MSFLFAVILSSMTFETNVKVLYSLEKSRLYVPSQQTIQLCNAQENVVVVFYQHIRSQNQ